jgi:hypothetical protein
MPWTAEQLLAFHELLCPVEWDSLLPRMINSLTPNDLLRRRAVSLLKIKIPSKNMRVNPTNTPIIHSVY